MLPADARLRRREDFHAAIRSGLRARRGSLVVHYDAADSVGANEVGASAVVDGRLVPDLTSARIGFVVSRSVGGAVIRNRVSRRLRHVCRSQLRALPHGARIVVRAQPSAARASSHQLARDLSGALSRLGLIGTERPR